MDLRKLKTLIDLVSESNVSELEITEAEGKVRIVKTPPPSPAPAVYAAQMPVMAAPQTAPIGATACSLPAAGGAPAAAPATTDTPAAAEQPAGHAVKSPMVGTFYRASSPGAEPFVEVGSTVKAGETLCIIEAMKILNEIEAEISGTVTQILCNNGDAVEYGQTLFIIE
ncbi:MAG: acetyl-CoA carboxylase biotin carboxyl carrier protein [Brachymonas sp.]|nr:acetyl-CoA carboxylase biotin carboxyl carrier protein [Brachymonas sp.]